MTKAKNTKRALLASVLSMLLCVAMLVGSTFAWFTDSVTSGKNKIVAGNLDVELEYSTDGSTWETVAENTNMFKDDALWEPGHVEVVNLKVANVGTLALTYKLGINVASETGSTNVNDEAFKLSDYIKFAVLDGDNTYDTRDAAIAAAEGTAVDLSALAVDEESVLYPKAKATDVYPDSRYVTLVVYMPTTVGNEANYKTGENAPEIELGISLVATQTPLENDSFGNTYDENVEYTAPSGGESDRPFTLDLTATSSTESDSEIRFIAETTETEDGSLFKARIDGLLPSDRKYNGCSFVFPIKGTSDKDVKLVFDFRSFKDVYAKAGNYRDYNDKQFQLVGDYWPVTVKIEHTNGNAINFDFTGTLTELVKKLSESPVVLEAGTAYDEVFTVTVSWPYETAATEDCYILNSKGVEEDLMDLADTVITDWDGDPEKVGNELCAEFEVKFQKVN